MEFINKKHTFWRQLWYTVENLMWCVHKHRCSDSLLHYWGRAVSPKLNLKETAASLFLLPCIHLKGGYHTIIKIFLIIIVICHYDWSSHWNKIFIKIFSIENPGYFIICSDHWGRHQIVLKALVFILIQILLQRKLQWKWQILVTIIAIYLEREIYFWS